MKLPTPPPRLDIARLPTPIHRLERLSAAWGGPSLWVKRDDLTGSVLTGNKIRKLQYAVHEAQREGADTLVTCGGLQSNHCRAAAVLARQLGLDVVLMLRGDGHTDRQGNHLLARIVGAEIRYVSPETYRNRTRELAAIAEELRASSRRPYVISEGCSMPMGVWGYIECAQEIEAQAQALGVSFHTIAHAVGSGGTSAGLELGTQISASRSRVLGFAVCDDTPTFQAQIQVLMQATVDRFGLGLSVSTPNILDHSVGAGYAAPSPAELETIVEVARLEGLLLDPVYTGRAMHGLRQEIAAGRFSADDDVLFVHTGGVFGLYPFAQDLPL